MNHAFLEAAVWHGPLDAAEAILAAHPEIAMADIHTAAALGEEDAVRRFIAQDPASAMTPGGPHGWDPLTYLCFSRYLRLDPTRTDRFISAATVLLDAGASPNTGFWSPDHRPDPEWECVLYGAAAVAQQAELTRLLLARGADPNDNETPYHVTETYDNTVLRLLVESGKLNPTSLTTMLLRKCDWHDFEGIKYLLEHDADPNRATIWGYTALQQAIRRDNSVKIIQVLLDHGARHESAARMAARRGRGDVLELLNCNDETIDEAELKASGGKLLAEFAGNDNTEGVRQLLDRGVPVNAPYDGDEYFGIPADSTALHVAAWRAAHNTVKLLIERGAAVNVKDGNGRTALELAERARTDSYWTYKSAPDSVDALRAAGAHSRKKGKLSD
ncbi:MAG TPA: ankyrin repeat domain-containing protein [Bryobacteraceae bacterium]|nr:ankyrin repeat domain-containing protein [Bryobacteraceae bacterium]